MKSKIVAGIFALLLGGFGAHHFYLNHVWLGVLYVLFFWTGVPGIVGLVEGILYLTMSDEDFDLKYNTLNNSISKDENKA